MREKLIRKTIRNKDKLVYIIYDNFGDLYDIPIFAYKYLMKLCDV